MTEQAHTVSLTAFTDLETAARQVRTMMLDGGDDIELLRHATTHATDPHTVADLLDRLYDRLMRAHTTLNEAL